MPLHQCSLVGVHPFQRCMCYTMNTVALHKDSQTGTMYTGLSPGHHVVDAQFMPSGIS